MKVIPAPLKTQEHQKIAGVITRTISSQARQRNSSLRVFALIPLLLTLGATNVIGASAPTSASGATPTRETPTTPRQAYTEYLNEREASKLTQSYDLKMSEGTSMEAIIRTGQPGDYHYSAIVTFALEQEESPKKSDPFCYVSTDEHLEIITYQKNPHQEENNISYDDTHQRTANRQDLQDLEGLQTLPDTLKKQLPTQALQIDSKLKTNLLSWNVSEHPFKTQETSADTPNMTTSDNIFEEMVTGLGFLLLTQYHNLATRHTTSIINPSHQLARIFHTDLLRRPGSKSDPALDSHCDLGGMYTYSPASQCSSALPHPPSQSPRHDQYKISGLEERGSIFKTPQKQRPPLVIRHIIGTSSDRLPSHLLNLIPNLSHNLLKHLDSITNSDLPGELPIGHEVKTTPTTEKPTTWGEDVYLNHLLHPEYRPKDSSITVFMNFPTNLKRPASPIAQGENPTSSSGASSSSLPSGSLGGIRVAEHPSSPGSFFPRTTTTNWNDPSSSLKQPSSSDLCSIVEASSAKRPRPDESYKTQPSTIATSSASSSPSTLKPLEDLRTNIENSLRLARAEGGNEDIISGYVESLERLNQAIQAINNGNITLSSYYQGSAIALFKKSEAQAKAKDDQGLFGEFSEQVHFHNEEAVLCFEQLRGLFDQAATVYERGDHQAAEEWDHKAQFLKKAFETIGFGILAPKDSELAGNDFGQPSIDHVKMLELLREGKITKEFCDQYLNEQELASILHNALAENIQAIEEKIKLVESFSEHSLKTKHCLEQLQGQLGELEERENNNLLNVSTQKDQIQNSITALEAIVLTPMTKEKLLNFFDAHKNASTYLQESLSFWEAESQENTIQGILKTLKNLHQEYSTSRNQENRCIFILDAAQRIRDVCLRGDVERINAFITPLKKRTEYRSLAAEKKDQGNPEDQGNPATEARYWNDAADACLCEAGELAKDTPNDVLAAAHGQSAQYYAQAAEAWAQGNYQEAIYWNNAGDACFWEARELAKNRPNEAAAAAYRQGAQYYTQAAEAWAQGNRQEAITWYHAGMMRKNQAQELAENSPHEKVAEAYRQEQSAMKTLPRQSPEDVLM